MSQTPLPLIKGTLDVIILRTLSWGPAHGYAISRWIRQTTRDDIQIEEGALYPALRRLEEKGWVEATWQTTETGREAKVYRLSGLGRRELKAELTSWTRYVAAMKRILETEPREALS